MSQSRPQPSAAQHSSRLRSDIVWSQRWISPYESLYSVLQKIAWANVAGAADLNKLLFGVSTRTDITGWGHSRSLLLSRWLPLPGVVLSPGFSTLAGTLSHFAGDWAHCLADDRHIRFCRTCLQDGYHSPFFQIHGIVRCPIHKEALTSRCTNCGACTTPYALCRETFLRPFFCGGCDRPLASHFDPARFYIEQVARRTIGLRLKPIAAWLEDLRRLKPPVENNGDRAAPLGQLRLFPEHQELSTECLFFRVATALVELRLPPACVDSSPLLIRAVSISTRTAVRNDPANCADVSTRTRQERVIYNSVRRYLERTYLTGHRKCLRHATNDLRVDTTCQLRGVSCHQEICPNAQAFLRWLLTYPWDELHNPFRQHRAARPWHTVPRHGHRHDPDNKLFAWELLTHFHSCASIALLLALRELKRLGTLRSKAEFKRPAPFIRPSVLWRVENAGLLVHLTDSHTPIHRYGLVTLDPAFSYALDKVGAPICRNYRKHGSVALRHSMEAADLLSAPRSKAPPQ
jgi:hypothetical protein